MPNSNKKKCIIWVTVSKTVIKISTYAKYIDFGQLSGSINITHNVFKHVLYCANIWF